MAEPFLVNFHCHSIFSDGNQTPEVLARNLAGAGVRYASLTDHDTLEGLPRFQAELDSLGVAFIPGVEITTFHHGKEIHLLAYGFDVSHVELNATLLSIRQSRKPEVHSISNTIRNATTNHTVGGELGLTSLTEQGGMLNTETAIALIHSAGGLCFLAHPLYYVNRIEDLEELLLPLIRHGLDGIEAVYAQFSEDQQQLLCDLAKKHSLLISAGTDFHGVTGLGNHSFAISIRNQDWLEFRKRLFTTSSFTDHKKAADPTASAGKNSIPAMPRAYKRERKRSYLLRIMLPTLAVLLIFLAVIWGYLLPSFEDTLLDRKREMIRELTNSAWSILASYHQDQLNGIYTQEQAQKLAISQIETLRYGPELKDYFWIQDYLPRMIMHPYRQDLNGKDLSNFSDPRGVLIFVKFAELVQSDGEGYIDYVWQWNDDRDRLEPKESFLKGFSPWQWVIGTGIYTDDVEDEIARLERNMVITTFIISGIITLLLAFVLQQSFGIEKERRRVLNNLKESTEKYHALAEATTEGTLLTIDQRCRYANPTMLAILGYSLQQLEFLTLKDVLPETDINQSIWEKLDVASIESGITVAASSGHIKNNSGVLKECIITLNPIQFAGQPGLILLCKEIDHQSMPEQRQGYVQMALTAPVGLIRARAQAGAPILEINSAARKLLRITPQKENQIGKLSEIFHEKADFDQFLSDLTEKNETHTEILVISETDASVRTLEMTARLEKNKGDQEPVIIVAIDDITGKRKHELEQSAIVEKLQSSLLFLHEPIAAMSTQPVICNLSTSIERVATIMTTQKVSAALVATDQEEIVGIVTDRDLRERVLAQKINTTLPVSRIMTAPISKINSNALIYEALLLMEEKGLSHLAVEDESGQIIRVVDSKSLIQFQSYGPIILLREIKKSNTFAEVAENSDRIPMMVKSLIENSSRTRHVTKMLSSVGDAVAERVVQLAIQECGTPPCKFSFMVLGSHGRQEQTLLTDQDNAIVYHPENEQEKTNASQYFLALGRKINQGLADSGYRRCRGNIMAENPFWCRSLMDWHSNLQEWLHRSEPQEIMRLSIFFDARPIFGDEQLVHSLRAYFLEMLDADPGYYFHAAQASLNFKAPTRLLGNIYLGGGNVEHPGEINLKDAMMPVVSYARLYALKFKLKETNTQSRILALAERKMIATTNAEEVCSAYEFLMQLRLKKQLDTILDGENPQNIINPAALGHMQRELLKQAFAQIAAIQKKISYDFLGGM